MAQWTAQRADEIFEGKVDRADLKSPLLDASVGDIVPANIEQGEPVMLVSFTASHFYRGIQQQHVTVQTGLGGGDCGFPFEIGREYLVYAYKDDSGRLTTGICTGTGRLEESAVDLAYLRSEQLPIDHGLPRSDPGKLCVRIAKTTADSADARLLLLRVGNVSPIPVGEAEATKSGRFCADVEPGDYHLLYLGGNEDSPTSFAYYPGVTRISDATPITIRPAQSISNLIFKIPPQPIFSVTGSVATSNDSRLPAEAKVILISADQPFFSLFYSQDVLPNGTFQFSRVLPGKYWAFVDVDSDSGRSDSKSSWSTRKTEVIVQGDVGQLSLTIIPR